EAAAAAGQRTADPLRPKPIGRQRRAGQNQQPAAQAQEPDAPGLMQEQKQDEREPADQEDVDGRAQGAVQLLGQPDAGRAKQVVAAAGPVGAEQAQGKDQADREQAPPAPVGAGGATLGHDGTPRGPSALHQRAARPPFSMTAWAANT